MKLIDELGYTLVSYPIAGLEPLSLLSQTQSGIVKKLNSKITSLFIPDLQACPQPDSDEDMADDLSGEQTVDLSAKVNLNFLQALTKLFSKNLSADLSTEKNKVVILKINNAKKSSVDPILLDSFITTAKLNTGAKSFVEALEKNEIYVVTEVLKSNDFTIREDVKSGSKVNVDLGVKNIAELSGNRDAGSDTQKKIECKGDTYYTIAVIAYRIRHDKDEPGVFKIKLADDLAAVRGVEDFQGEKIREQDGFLTMQV